MSSPFLLTGRQAVSRRPRLQIWILLFTLLGTLFLSGLYFLPSNFSFRADQGTLKTKSNLPIVAQGNSHADDVAERAADALKLHIRNSNENHNETIANLRQAQARIKAVQINLAREYMDLEKGRLEKANALIEKAIQQTRHASDELNVASSVLNNN